MTLIDHFQQKRRIRLMKDKPGGKIMTEFAPLRPKKCEYLEKYKEILKFNDYKDCLFKNQIILKPQQRFKNEERNIYTEEINKIAQSSSDDKRLQTFDRITSYPYGTNAGRVCETPLLKYVNIK